MLGALESALGDQDAARAGLLRQVVFMTDGAVGNEDELFAYIQAHLGDSRLFTVGIGAAPSSYFMTRAARPRPRHVHLYWQYRGGGRQDGISLRQAFPIRR